MTATMIDDAKFRAALRTIIPVIMAVLKQWMQGRSSIVAQLVITDERAAALTDALATVEDYLLEE